MLDLLKGLVESVEKLLDLLLARTDDVGEDAGQSREAALLNKQGANGLLKLLGGLESLLDLLRGLLNLGAVARGRAEGVSVEELSIDLSG